MAGCCAAEQRRAVGFDQQRAREIDPAEVRARRGGAAGERRVGSTVVAVAGEEEVAVMGFPCRRAGAPRVAGKQELPVRRRLELGDGGSEAHLAAVAVAGVEGAGGVQSHQVGTRRVVGGARRRREGVEVDYDGAAARSRREPDQIFAGEAEIGVEVDGAAVAEARVEPTRGVEPGDAELFDHPFRFRRGAALDVVVLRAGDEDVARGLGDDLFDLEADGVAAAPRPEGLGAEARVLGAGGVDSFERPFACQFQDLAVRLLGFGVGAGA